jgi:hypothetical protein
VTKVTHNIVGGRWEWEFLSPPYVASMRMGVPYNLAHGDIEVDTYLASVLEWCLWCEGIDIGLAFCPPTSTQFCQCILRYPARHNAFFVDRITNNNNNNCKAGADLLLYIIILLFTRQPVATHIHIAYSLTNIVLRNDNAMAAETCAFYCWVVVTPEHKMFKTTKLFNLGSLQSFWGVFFLYLVYLFLCIHVFSRPIIT